MRAGALGEPRRWAIEHQIGVGEFFDAADLVPVAQAHIMADTESLGDAGVHFLEGLAAAPAAERRLRDGGENKRRLHPLEIDLRGRTFFLNLAIDHIHDRTTHELGDEEISRPGIDFRRSTYLLQNPVIHNCDSVGHGHRFDLVVGDIDGRRSVINMQAP